MLLSFPLRFSVGRGHVLLQVEQVKLTDQIEEYKVTDHVGNVTSIRSDRPLCENLVASGQRKVMKPKWQFLHADEIPQYGALLIFHLQQAVAEIYG